MSLSKTTLCPTAISAIEQLESRRMLSATVVYVETNDPLAGSNAVIGYSRNPTSGALTELTGGVFKTYGTGFQNPGVLGPDDSDQEVVASPGGKWLFAVNQGSGSISSFAIQSNGSLKFVGVFNSGGVQPDSIAIEGDHLYVANRGNEGGSSEGTVAPNYTAFTIQGNGALKAIQGSTIWLNVGASPAQLLATHDGKIFANNFTAPKPTAQNNVILPLLIGADGKLTGAPSGPVGTRGLTAGAVLGLAKNPKYNIIYAGLPADGKIGIYQYNSSGKVSWDGAVSSGDAGACWLVTSADGKYLYATDSAINTVSVYSLANPLHPVEIQNFKLAGPLKPAGASATKTTDFQLALDPTGKWLYVVNHTTDPNFQQGNQLHQLNVGSDGKLSETLPVIAFDPGLAPGNAHPQGIAIVNV